MGERAVGQPCKACDGALRGKKRGDQKLGKKERGGMKGRRCEALEPKTRCLKGKTSRTQQGSGRFRRKHGRRHARRSCSGIGRGSVLNLYCTMQIILGRM